MRIVERADLYRAIWNKPALKVAAGLGISSSALKRICIAMDIPTPPSGFWAGKTRLTKILKPRLPKATKDTRLKWEFDPKFGRRQKDPGFEERERKSRIPEPAATVPQPIHQEELPPPPPRPEPIPPPVVTVDPPKEVVRPEEKSPIAEREVPAPLPPPREDFSRKFSLDQWDDVADRAARLLADEIKEAVGGVAEIAYLSLRDISRATSLSRETIARKFPVRREGKKRLVKLSHYLAWAAQE